MWRIPSSGILPYTSASIVKSGIHRESGDQVCLQTPAKLLDFQMNPALLLNPFRGLSRQKFTIFRLLCSVRNETVRVHVDLMVSECLVV